MKLIYRGVTYDYDPTREPIDDRFDHIREPITLTYRGNRYRLTPGRTVTDTYQPRTSYELMYRGNKYLVHRENEEPTVRPVAPQAKQKSIQDLVTRMHHDNLERNLAHRIEVARQRGDLSLMAMLEAERRQLV